MNTSTPFFTSAQYDVLQNLKITKIKEVINNLNEIIKQSPEKEKQMILFPRDWGAYDIKCYIKEWSHAIGAEIQLGLMSS